MDAMALSNLSDDELLAGLSAMMTSTRRLAAKTIAYLIEVQERRLDLKAACSSLFDFCMRKLGMSEGEAFRRINAARLVRRFPNLLGRLERGEIHLSALVLLRDHLTEATYEELVVAAAGKSKREIQELLARRAPRPDVPTMVRRLPEGSRPPATVSASSPETGGQHARPRERGKLEPLAEARYKLQLTASRELHDEIGRATQLMRHRNPDGDLAVVLERALDLLITALEKQRLGKTRPRASQSQPSTRQAASGAVTRAARREVFARDGEQCTFVSDAGERCPERAFLELDHIDARANGGGGTPANLRVRCKAHNGLHAEETFGKDYIRKKIHLCQRERPPRSAGDEPPDVFALAATGLANLGFRAEDSRRTVGRLRDRVAKTGTATPSIEDVLREALAILR